jgi:hypothetical protein
VQAEEGTEGPDAYRSTGSKLEQKDTEAENACLARSSAVVLKFLSILKIFA